MRTCDLTGPRRRVEVAAGPRTLPGAGLGLVGGEPGPVAVVSVFGLVFGSGSLGRRLLVPFCALVRFGRGAGERFSAICTALTRAAASTCSVPAGDSDDGDGFDGVGRRGRLGASVPVTGCTAGLSCCSVCAAAPGPVRSPARRPNSAWSATGRRGRLRVEVVREGRTPTETAESALPAMAATAAPRRSGDGKQRRPVRPPRSPPCGRKPRVRSSVGVRCPGGSDAEPQTCLPDRRPGWTSASGGGRWGVRCPFRDLGRH